MYLLTSDQKITEKTTGAYAPAAIRQNFSAFPCRALKRCSGSALQTLIYQNLRDQPMVVAEPEPEDGDAGAPIEMESPLLL